MYTASIHDPISSAQLRIIANTHADLRHKVINEIDRLRKQIVDLFLYAGAVLSAIGLLSTSIINITPFGWIVVPLVIVAYLQQAPFWINPMAHIWYLRKCMRAWEREFERITAPDSSADR